MPVDHLRALPLSRGATLRHARALASIAASGSGPRSGLCTTMPEYDRFEGGDAEQHPGERSRVRCAAGEEGP
jgi:hypothetical protein